MTLAGIIRRGGKERQEDGRANEEKEMIHEQIFRIAVYGFPWIVWNEIDNYFLPLLVRAAIPTPSFICVAVNRDPIDAGIVNFRAWLKYLAGGALSVKV